MPPRRREWPGGVKDRAVGLPDLSDLSDLSEVTSPPRQEAAPNRRRRRPGQVPGRAGARPLLGPAPPLSAPSGEKEGGKAVSAGAPPAPAARSLLYSPAIFLFDFIIQFSPAGRLSKVLPPGG